MRGPDYSGSWHHGESWHQAEVDDEGDHHSWAVSYADMVTLLFVLFLVVAAMSSINKRKFEQLTEAINGVSTPNGLEQVVKDLESKLQGQGLSGDVQVLRDKQGVALEIKDSLLFESGKADIPPAAAAKMEAVLQSLASLPDKYHFLVEGHTDDAPINTPAFKNNWQLGASRAVAVIGLFTSAHFDAHRLTAQTFADTRPLLANRGENGKPDEEHRRRNRRVVIRVL